MHQWHHGAVDMALPPACPKEKRTHSPGAQPRSEPHRTKKRVSWLWCKTNSAQVIHRLQVHHSSDVSDQTEGIPYLFQFRLNNLPCRRISWCLPAVRHVYIAMTQAQHCATIWPFSWLSIGGSLHADARTVTCTGSQFRR